MCEHQPAKQLHTNFTSSHWNSFLLWIYAAGNEVTDATPKTGQGASSLKYVFLLTSTYNFLLLLMITYHYVLFFLLVNFLIIIYVCNLYHICVCVFWLYLAPMCPSPHLLSLSYPSATTPRSHQSPSQIHDIWFLLLWSDLVWPWPSLQPLDWDYPRERGGGHWWVHNWI